MTIEELEERQRQLEEELDEISSKLYQAKLAKHGLSIGCIVINNGNELKVSGAEFILISHGYMAIKEQKKAIGQK